jgi:hypothetical protein
MTAELCALLRAGPFHAALRAAIRQRGLTLDRLRTHLARHGISVALSSLSDWQHGNVRPAHPNSLRAVAALEEILGLPGGALVDLLARTDPTGRPEAMHDLLPGYRANDLDVVARQDKVFVDAQRRASLVQVRAVTRARRDGVDRYFAHYYADGPISAGGVTITPLQRCQLGRIVHEPDKFVMASELLFDRALKAGDTWVFEYQVHHPDTETTAEYAHGIRGFEEHSLIEVQFHPETLPVDCHVYIQHGPGDAPERTADLVLGNDCSVHHLETASTACWIGIRWTWR